MQTGEAGHAAAAQNVRATALPTIPGSLLAEISACMASHNPYAALYKQLGGMKAKGDAYHMVIKGSFVPSGAHPGTYSDHTVDEVAALFPGDADAGARSLDFVVEAVENSTGPRPQKLRRLNVTHSSYTPLAY